MAANHRLKVGAPLFAVGSLWLAASAAHAGGFRDDCVYVPLSVSQAELVASYEKGTRVPVSETTVNYAVEKSGCKPQSIARIFCLGDNPSFDVAKSSLAEVVKRSKLVNCDLKSPGVRPAKMASANECMIQATEEPFRFAKVSTPSKKGPQDYKDFTFKYGISSDHLETEAPVFSLPDATTGKASQGCKVCSAMTVAGKLIKAHLLCAAQGDQCPTASGCAAEMDKGKAANPPKYELIGLRDEGRARPVDGAASVGGGSSGAGSANPSGAGH